MGKPGQPVAEKTLLERRCPKSYLTDAISFDGFSPLDVLGLADAHKNDGLQGIQSSFTETQPSGTK